VNEGLVPYQLAYEASVHAISDQASVLESLRSRAGTLFAATALVTSFLGGFALARVEGSEGELDLISWSLGGLATGLFIVLALLTLAILWPHQVRFSVSAAEMLAIVDDRKPDDPVGAEEAYRELALRYEAMYDLNADRIRALLWLFRLAIVCLVAEVFAWIGVLQEVA
jgi:hypothetical protein